MKSLQIKIRDAKDFIQDYADIQPEIGMILGSGLGSMVDDIEDAVYIPYGGIPHFPVSTVEGHAGRLVLGTLEQKKIAVMQGRFHFYEGYSLAETTFPVRVIQSLGAKYLIVTNAAGGINKSYSPGNLMLISDHINLMGSNPLIGPNYAELGERFPDMSEAYSKKLREIAKTVAQEEQIQLQEGVYCAMSGPSYETPAEIHFLDRIGADGVGMSTVPEVIIGNHSKMQVLGISCITNMAAGVKDEKLNHEEVIAVGNEAVEKLARLVKGVLRRL